MKSVLGEEMIKGGAEGGTRSRVRVTLIWGELGMEVTSSL